MMNGEVEGLQVTDTSNSNGVNGNNPPAYGEDATKKEKEHIP